MSVEKLSTTRRNLLIGAGVGGLAGIAFAGSRLAYATPEDFVADMTRRALPDAVIPEGVLQEFAADYVSELKGERLKSLDDLVLLSALVTTPGIEMLLGTDERYKNFRRTTVTQFMIKSNFFASDGGKTARLEYYGYLPCGQNPFAQYI